MKHIAKTALIILLAAVMASLSLLYLSATSENHTNVDGRIYEFEEKSDYDIENAETTNSSAIAGRLTVSGGVDNTTTYDGIPVYEVADNELLAFSYDFDRSLLTAPSEEWHLTDDSKKTVNGIRLDDKIEYGAIILQTSLDGEKWILTKVITNAFEDAETLSEPFYETNDIQLNNGCYYRITVAYKMEMEVDPSKFCSLTRQIMSTKNMPKYMSFTLNTAMLRNSLHRAMSADFNLVQWSMQVKIKAIPKLTTSPQMTLITAGSLANSL